MKAHVTASSKYHPKTEKPIVLGEPERTPLPYAPLYPSLSPKPLAALAAETSAEPAPSLGDLSPLAPLVSTDVTSLSYLDHRS